MNAKQHLEQSMQEEQIREALNTHWHASAAGDANAEHDIYDDDAICDYPQSGERILGRSNLQALRSHHPGKPSGFNVKRIPQRKGRARDTVFRGSLRGARLAEPMGSADRVTPHRGEIEPRSAAELFIPSESSRFQPAIRLEHRSRIRERQARVDSYRKAKSGHVLTRKVAVYAI
jgi:hypothetical protein